MLKARRMMFGASGVWSLREPPGPLVAFSEENRRVIRTGRFDGVGRSRGVTVTALLVAIVLILVLMAGCSAGQEEDNVSRGANRHASGRSGTPAGTAAPPTDVTWVPVVGQPWQWQLSGRLDVSVDVPVYDVDWQNTSVRTVSRLHGQGRRVICYVSVGTWESYRPDAGGFPKEVLGKPLEDWPDERWVDIRRLDVLGPILRARLDVCREKGFDAVEPDNVDAFANDSGFPLAARDQLAFNRWVAREVRARGMAVGLKNDVEQVPDLVADFDFAVNEECMQYDECERLQPFVDAGKAVLHVEYDVSPADFAAMDVPTGFSSMLKNRALDAWRVAHPATGAPSQP